MAFSALYPATSTRGRNSKSGRGGKKSGRKSGRGGRKSGRRSGRGGRS